MTETRLGNLPNVEFGRGLAETTVRARYNRQRSKENRQAQQVQASDHIIRLVSGM